MWWFGIQGPQEPAPAHIIILRTRSVYSHSTIWHHLVEDEVAEALSEVEVSLAVVEQADEDEEEVHAQKSQQDYRGTRKHLCARSTQKSMYCAMVCPSIALTEVCSEEQDQIVEDVKDDSSSDEDVPNSNAYQALLATYRTEGSSRKRRKLDTGSRERDRELQNGTTEIISQGNGIEQDAENGEVEQDPAGEEEDEDSDVDQGVVDGDFVDDEEDAADAFETRFDHPDEKELSMRLGAVKAENFQAEQSKSAVLGKIARLRPNKIVEDELPKVNSLKDIKLKKRLQDPALRLVSELTPLQKELGPIVTNYRDLLFGGRTVDNAGDLRSLACIHAMNHLYKTRDRILKNTARLARDTGTADLELRDQGFTRPKVLILLETRQMCVKYMDTITNLCEPEQQENRKRFQDTFVKADPEGFGHDKPADFCELFEGNDDNDFRLGIKFTRKTIKYYSQFYNSDIILASPLGLRRAMKDHEYVPFLDHVHQSTSISPV